MYAICIESSRSRGMGHLFRSLQYVEYFRKNKINFIYLINRDVSSIEILNSNNVEFILIDFFDQQSNWEFKIVTQYNITVWFNDKFNTSKKMGKHLSEIPNLLFCTIDDVGEGAKYADIFFAGMIYPTLKKLPGIRNFGGIEYIILNPEIDLYKRERKYVKKIIVTLGGSDPFGVTVEVVQCLKQFNYNVDIVIGPNFAYMNELEKIIPKDYNIFQYVPSLIRLFSEYDLAITGGGVTCCEACASGLPCIVIANAPHEINTGRYIERLGMGIYVGEHGRWKKKIFESIDKIPLKDMSCNGMKCFNTNAVQSIFKIIRNQLERDEKSDIL